jgi:threonine dehydrogenase-like Zn-dependent dehydrogenase
MRAAAVYPGTKTLGVVEDFAEPQVTSATGVKLRILQVGVCGTDREIASFVYGMPPEGSEYLVLGHEALGEVVEVGAGVTGFRVGDLAIPMVRMPCSHEDCVACRHERPDFCMTGDYVEHGIMKLHGFMTEFVVVEERYLNAVPAAIREVGVLVEPLTIAEKALLQAVQVQARLPWEFTAYQHRAVVLGAGPVGLLGAMALQNRGYAVTVYSKDREPNPGAEIVKAIGGRYLSSQDCTVDQLITEVGEIDLVYEATGAANLAFDVLRALGPNGLYVLTGVPGLHGPTEFDTEGMMRNLVLKNQCLLGTVNAGKDAFEAAIEDLQAFFAKWPEAVRGLITGRFGIDQFAEPILKPSGIKNIIEMARQKGAK